jgi:hypothetical protein
LYPLMLEDVLAFQDKLTVWAGAGVPVPVSASMVVAGCALLLKLSEALADPLACGLNVTVKGALWPAGMVTGSERPPILKTELFELAPVTVTFAPVAVKPPDAVPLRPTTTLPRPSVVGVTESCPAEAAPEPVRGTVRDGLEALEVMVTFPLTLACSGRSE